MLKLPGPEELSAGLLAWFDRCKRDLPWRRSEEPYEILVAEVMLQQTRSEVVATRYEGFLARFPTLATLASARVVEVEAAWTGLGYYRRARNLHRAARIVAERGAFPVSAAEWMELPGRRRLHVGPAREPLQRRAGASARRQRRTGAEPFPGLSASTEARRGQTEAAGGRGATPRSAPPGRFEPGTDGGWIACLPAAPSRMRRLPAGSRLQGLSGA